MSGERGPKGDHGQHGDAGDTGDAGVQGERGATGYSGERGKTGDTGATGRRGPSQWLPYIFMGVAVLAAFWAFHEQNVSQQRAVARTTRQNCQQIELVKGQIRGTVRASVKRLPTIAYYRKRPAELRQAIRDAEASVARFAPVNCQKLPAVRSATPASP